MYSHLSAVSIIIHGILFIPVSAVCFLYRSSEAGKRWPSASFSEATDLMQGSH